MTDIEKVRFEVLAPDPERAEQIQAYIDEMVARQVAEIMARRDLSAVQPFFESEEISDELRRIQTAPDLHKWSTYNARFGCLICETRERRHCAVGMCQRCLSRVAGRLHRIRKHLNEKSERAENLIEQERRAYKACVEANVPGLKPLLPRLEPPKMGKLKMKPTILAGDSGARVRQLRELAGLSQEGLAKAAGVNRRTIINFEKGRHKPLPSHCDAIRKILVEALVRAFWP